MSFIRIKATKRGDTVYCYAMRVRNKYMKRTKTVKQKVVKYIGKVKGLEPYSFKEIMERDNYTCQECNAKEDLTIDHIIPLSAAGTNESTNLQVLCMACNQKKGKKA